MSFTQRAKKKLASLSKRKKLKHAEKEHIRPPSLQVPRFPLPDDSDSQRNLSSSISLPDQLDQSELTNVSKISSKSLSSIETSGPSITLLSYVSDTTSRPRVLNRLHSTPTLSQKSSEDHLTNIRTRENQNNIDASERSLHANLVSTVSHSLNDDACQQTTSRKDNTLGKLSLLSRHGHSLDSGLYSHSSHIDFEKCDYSPWTSRSPGENFTENNSSECQSPAGLISTTNRSSRRSFSTGEDTDESRSVEGDLGISEEDSETCDEVFKLDSAESIATSTGSDILRSGSYSNTNIGVSANDFHRWGKDEESENQTSGFDQTTNIRCNLGGSEKRIPGLTEAPKVSPKDNSVVKKIRFFENYGEHKSKSTNCSQNSKLFTEMEVSGRSAFAGDLDSKTAPNKGVTSDDDSDGGHSSSKVKQQKSGPSYKMFPNCTQARQRLNFSRFKRSDSIPEVVAVCACDDLGRGGCEPGAHDRVVDCQVCHHPECTEDNDDLPLMLCSECDLQIHQTHSDHLVLDTRPAHYYIDEENNHAPNIDSDVSDREDKPEVENTRNELDNFQQNVSNKEDNSQIDQELSNTMTLKNASYNMEPANKMRTGSEGEIIALAHWRNAESYQTEDQKSASLGRNSSMNGGQASVPGTRKDLADVTTSAAALGSSRAKVAANDGCFTLRFGDSAGREEEFVVVAVSKNKSLREAIEPVLQARNMDVGCVNVFIEKSQTPLYMSCDTKFLAGNILEVKEKDTRYLSKPLKKTASKRAEAALERSSRRDSFGLATPLTEAPSSKQRRGSMQLPFKEHFFTRSDSRHESPRNIFTRSDSRNEGPKIADDVSGSIRGLSKIPSTFTEDPTTPSAATSSLDFRKPRSSKYPKLGSINKDKEKPEQLSEILNKYSVNGLPPFPELLDLGRKKFDDTMFNMESSWKVIVENHEDLSKTQHDHQEAVWELLHTEVSYIKQIRVIIEVFQNCLMNIQLESFLNEIESERLFSNIDKIYECNCLFWQHHLLPILQSSRESRQPLDPLLSKEGFIDHFPILFQVYFKYFIEQKSCLDYAKSCMDNNDLFRTFVQWAETQKQCNRLKFSDILGQPMPRLLRYSLLLRAILKYTEKDNDRTDVKAMIQSVDKLCGAANNSLRRIEEYKRLEAVRKTLEPFDSIEAPNDECAKIIQGFVGNFNLLAPMPGSRDGPRTLLFQSSLRMKEGQNVKMDVDCLLFTDLLLICKSNRKMERFKIIRPPMRLDHLVMRELKDKNSFMLIYMNEYNVPLSAFTFYSDPGSIRGWVEKFREAQKEFKAKDTQKSSETDRLNSDTILTQSDLDDMSVTSAFSYLDIVTSTISRSESSNSIDHFVPNVLTANEAISDMNQTKMGHSNSTPKFKSIASGLSAQSYDQNSSADVKLVLPSCEHNTPFTEDGYIEVINGSVHKYPDKHTPAHMVSVSVPKRMEGNGNNSISADTKGSEPTYLVTASDESCGLQRVMGEDRPSFQRNSERLDPQVADSGQKSSTREDIVNTKLNSRRTEKRYHTADEIPDILNSQKDPGFQKWSSLRKDVPLCDLQDLGSTVLSTDSCQSYQSSSGVSSNGSLHLAVEIIEENDAVCDGDVFVDSHLTKVNHPKHLFVNDSGGINEILDFTDGGSTKSLSEPRSYLAESKHAKSKSTSDLVDLFGNGLQVNQMTDGIASVAVTPENFHRKLTQLDIRRLKQMKHQILFDANVESSEV